MKITSILLVFSLLLQATISLACQNHSMEAGESSVEAESHCHQEATSKTQQPHEDEKSQKPCPICDLGLCVEKQVIVLQDKVFETKSQKDLVLFQEPLFISSLDFKKVIKQRPWRISDPLLPQHKNWQAYYSVFLN